MSAWRRLTFALPDDLLDDVIVCLHERGTLGVESAGGLLHAWFPAPLDEHALLTALRADLGRRGGECVLAGSEEIADGFWHERWQAGLTPIPAGKGFLIVPGPATPPDAAGRRVIRLTPGRAFGTGEHATTRMCLELMESRLSPGDGALDVGTGSGILALAAKLMGADPVVGLDVDPVAVEVAARNAAINDVSGILFAVGGPRAIRAPRRFECLLANLNGVTLVRLMEDLAALASRVMILSGILREEEAAVVERAGAERFGVGRRMEEGDWVALLMERAGR